MKLVRLFSSLLITTSSLFILGNFSLHSFESPNYQTLAPHHIQQDRPTGCSLASSVVLINSIKSTFMSQSTFRDWLRSQKTDKDLLLWARATDYRGWGISIYQLPALLIKSFQKLDIKAKIEVNYRPKFSYSKFLSDIESANNDPNVFILINYPYKGNGHWSPLASFNKTTNIMQILNVDSLWRYGKEISIPVGLGVDSYKADYFFKKWGGYRGYLKVTILPPSK